MIINSIGFGWVRAVNRLTYYMPVLIFAEHQIMFKYAKNSDLSKINCNIYSLVLVIGYEIHVGWYEQKINR